MSLNASPFLACELLFLTPCLFIYCLFNFNKIVELIVLISLIERTIQNLHRVAECSADISNMASLEIEILRKLTDSHDEVSSFSVQVEC